MSAAVELFGPTAPSTLEEMQRLESAIASMDAAAEVADVEARARLAAKLMRAVGAAEEMLVAAFRIQARALRRLGQITDARPEGMSPRLWNTAREFAALDPATFERHLHNVNRRNPTVTVMRYLIRSERAAADMDAKLRDADAGAPLPTETRWDPALAEQIVRDAVAKIMAATSIEAEFSVESLAGEIIDALDPPPGGWNNLSEAKLRDFVRNALNEATVTADPTADRLPAGYRLPRVITVQTHDGFIRVPLELASMRDLEWFVEFRESQAADLLERAESFRRLYDYLAATAPGPWARVVEVIEGIDPGDWAEIAPPDIVREARYRRARPEPIRRDDRPRSPSGALRPERYAAEEVRR